MGVYVRIILLITVGLALVFALLNARKVAPPKKSAEVEQTDTRTTPNVQVGVPAKIALDKAQPSRNVGTGVIAAPGTENAPLERIDPLPQPTPPAQPKPVEIKKPKSFERWRLVYNAVATSAGQFQANNITLVLPGIDIVSAGEKCTLQDGTSWPCGMVARTSLRSYINGKALNCKLPDAPEGNTVEADYTLRGRDLAEWLVANGWARAKDDGPYTQLQLSAEQASRGIFGNPPKGFTAPAP
jgi:endonuclease YncB( thermonuclease family)